MPVFVIAEAGVNHNGDAVRALDMVSVARDCGADAVKYQTFVADRLVSRAAPKAAYQSRETGGGNQYDMIRPLEMSADLHERLVAKCDEAGIEFMSTPFDEGSLDLLVGLGVRRLKIPSGEITNLPFIERFAACDLPIIVSTGMATLDEIDDALAAIARIRADKGFAAPMRDVATVLHCTSNYPAAMVDVNLRAMHTIACRTGLPVGYSDHTLGSTVALGAVALGATVIEKHFTLDRTLPGPDHSASMEPGELAQMIATIRDLEVALGSAEKKPTASELEVRAVARRSLTTARAVHAGETLSDETIVMLRPGTGISPAEWKATRGRSFARALDAGTTLEWSDLA